MPNLSLAFTLALAAGLATGVLFDLPFHWLASLVLAAGWVIALVSFQRGWPRVQLASLGVSAIMAGALLGSAAVDRALNPPLRVLLEQRFGGFAIDAASETRLEEPIVVEGRLRADGSPTETGVVLRIDVERVWLGPCPEPAAGGLSVTVVGSLQAERLAQWTAGRPVRMPAVLRRPARYLNWGLPDQERAMARRGTALVGTVKSAALVELLGRGRWWEEAAAAVRAATRRAMAVHVAPRDAQAAAIATALLIGDRAAIDNDVERRLQEAGTYHVIAISGGNIAILAGLVLAVLGLFRIRGRIAALVTIAILAGYAIVASGGASVARATLMASLYLAVRLIDQRTAAANAVALSGAALLLVNPLWTVDVGFWLTFGATSAILIGASRVRVPSQGWGAAAISLLLASVCAELALAPVSASAFQRVTLAGLLLNFAAIPCMTIVQIGAMALVFFESSGASLVASWIARIVELGTLGLTGSTRLLDVAPWLTWRVPAAAAVVMATYYAAIAFWWWASRSPLQWRRLAARSSAAVAVVLFLWIIVAPAARVRAYGDGRLHVTLVDVGQGDAMLVTFPNGRTLAVDAGGVTIRGDFDIGDRVVGPTFRARPLLRLDYLVVTHGDGDHIGGAQSLVRDFSPAEVWWGVPVANHAPTTLVRAQADRARGAWRTLQRGDRLEIAGVEVRVHHPPLPDWERQKVRNNDSLVLELRFGEVSVLLTGDIGREVEQELLPTLDLLPTVVLKVPHHGSGTSSSVAFVEKLKPAVALIGVGRGNPYGHPVPYVLERFHAAGTQVFRTDRDGEVEVVTDGSSLNVRSFSGRIWDSSKVSIRDTPKDRHEGTKGAKESHEGRMQ
jgi:competence protein ComEC